MGRFEPALRCTGATLRTAPTVRSVFLLISVLVGDDRASLTTRGKAIARVESSRKRGIDTDRFFDDVYQTLEHDWEDEHGTY